MIKIKKVSIEKFRGIQRLSIDLQGESFAIQGPNGSGKSGVIDAIEFGLTGTISRLTGMGTGGLTIRSHGPHVDERNHPENAKVTLELASVGGESIVIERKVSSPTQPVVSGKGAEQIQTFISDHPEFSLTRKDVLKFILAERGKRAKDVQTLLRMDAIDQARTSFQSLSTQMKRNAKSQSDSLDRAAKDLREHLKIGELREELILEAINQRRTLLQLPPIMKLGDTGFGAGIVGGKEIRSRSIPKHEVLQSITKVRNILEQGDGELTRSSKALLNDLQPLEKDPLALGRIVKQGLYETGLNLVTSALCPLCDTPWDDEAHLRGHILANIRANASAIEIKSAVEKSARTCVTVWESLNDSLSMVFRSATILQLIEEAETISSVLAKTKANVELLRNPFANLASTMAIGRDPLTYFGGDVRDAISRIYSAVEPLPELNEEESAKEYLTIAQERFKAYHASRAEYDSADEASKVAEELSSLFKQTSEKRLTALYDQVEADFSKFYRLLNGEDEGSFKAALAQVNGGLDLEVDFYGRGLFPPNAFHSEGHQDGMGLCLYFALAKHVLGDRFTFCLLDDVLMSVDVDHRREFCKLLKTEFRETQFVITTHDAVWARQLTSESVIGRNRMLHIRKWTVNDGPSLWDYDEIWDEIERDIKADRISDAAQGLRRYLEFIASELVIKMRASLEARPIASYDLGEMLPVLVGRYREYLKRAKAAANSWNQQALVNDIDAREKELSETYQRTNAEQWSVNAAVHYNEWANLSQSDFITVKEVFGHLLKQFKCSSCENWLYASPIKGNIDEIRCDCGETNLNLKKKS